MCETEIEFKCVNCGNLYNPKIELECPECYDKGEGIKNPN
ncbi:hypothetical protein Metbo_1738 [Methanobacterium lacus]|jgi:hypothetical protein|uniref:Uncharacterized protein n=1 Tax=Methanobacterium lacus (strain AL-21) TaxID=877455 RepID=F0T9T3_METLA|nr:hypothetical protein Metbo_1738 [Methanobacterium lacus]